jgi:hypothetical protein
VRPSAGLRHHGAKLVGSTHAHPRLVLGLDCRERALDETADRLGAADFLLFRELQDSLDRFSGKSRRNRRIASSGWSATWPLDQLFHLTTHLRCALRKGKRADDRVLEHSVALTPYHGVSMARRWSQRMRTHACAQEEVEGTQQANTVPWCFARLCCAASHESLAWLCGFNLGNRGDCHVCPDEGHNPLAWSLGCRPGQRGRAA